MRQYCHTWIGHHRGSDHKSLLDKALRNCDPTLSSLIQNLCEKLMQNWTEISLLTLQKLIETMSQRMCAAIKSLCDFS